MWSVNKVRAMPDNPLFQTTVLHPHELLYAVGVT